MKPILMAYNQHNRANILWRLGKPEEARRALAEAFQIASQPGSNYRALLPDIQLSYAQIYLSERKFNEAIRESETAIKLAGTQYPNVAIEANSTLGLAKSRSGATAEGLKLCSEAAAAAVNSGDVGLISRAMLAQAEAALEGGQTQLALDLANQACERLAKNAQYESEWRAWLIAGLASAKMGDRAASQTQMGRARGIRAQLEKKWNPEAYKQYLMRPDIQFFSNKLG